MNQENKILSELGIQPGDVVKIPKSGLEIVQHYAVYLGYDEQGCHYMSENKIGEGVCLTRVHVFFKDVSKITSIIKFDGTNEQRRQLVQNALRKLGLPYSIINYNCEHFVTDITTGNAISTQVKNGVLALIGIVFFIVFITD